MAKICDICGRSSKTSFSRSHSMRATKRKQYLNLQKVRVDEESRKICTACFQRLVKKEPERLR